MDLRHTHRIFVSGKLVQNLVVVPSSEQAHHLLHVLRLKNGDILRLFNGRDGEFRASVTITGKRTLELSIHEQLRSQERESDLWLCCAPIKKAHFDFMIEKATELGVSEIQPVLTQRTQVRDVNTDRAYNICREAAEQSNRLGVPAIGNPVSLEDMIDVFPHDRVLIVCAEWGEATSIHDVLQSAPLQPFTKAAIVTGPEGGFAAEELDKLKKTHNAFFVRLGSCILRAETAAIAALTCWQAVRGDWR